MKPLQLLLLIILNTLSFAEKVSYEGFIGDYPVCIDIETVQGEITGEYFYRNIGTPIELTGERVGDSLFLEEGSAKWQCVFFQNYMDDYTIEGEWYGDNGKTFPISLSFGGSKTFSVNWKRSDLPFAGKLSPENDPGEYEQQNFVTANLTFSKADIVQYSISYCGVGAYETWWSEYLLCDLSTKSVVTLSEELDSNTMDSLFLYINEKIQPKYTEFIEETETYSFENDEENFDSLWIYAFSPAFFIENRFNIGPEVERLDSSQIVHLANQIKQFNSGGLCNSYSCDLEFRLAQNGFVISQPEGYFRFPRVSRCMDFSWNITIPFTDLDYFLKSDSPLKRLTKQNKQEGTE